MKKVGLISDTHGTFSKDLKDFLSDVDVVLHCGDWGSIHTLEEVKSFKPVIGVYGNCDDQDIRLEVPFYQSFRLEDLSCLMIHIGGYPGRYDYRAFQLINQFRPDLFFCGHSHILKVAHILPILQQHIPELRIPLQENHRRETAMKALPELTTSAKCS